MHILDFLRTHPLSLPSLAKTAVFLAIMVGVPRLCQRLKIPGAVGLLLAGIVIGPYGFGFVENDGKRIMLAASLSILRPQGMCERTRSQITIVLIVSGLIVICCRNALQLRGRPQ